MNVSPIKLLNLQNYNAYSNNMTYSCAYISPFGISQDKFDKSFTGLYENSTVPVRLDQAQHISGIHCPGCGIRMLSRDDYENILKKAKNVQNAKELIELISENQKYIPNHLKQPLIKANSTIENPSEMTISQYYNKMRDDSFLYKKSIVHNTKDNLNDYCEWLKLPPEQNEKAHEIVNKIHTVQNYVTYKDIINEYVEFLDLPDKQANEIKKKALKPVVLSNDYFRIFHKSLKMPESEIAPLIIKGIFEKSVNRINPIDKYPHHKNLPNNKVLICGNCELTQNKATFMNDTRNPKNKELIENYLSDIAYLIGHDKIEESYDYIKAFCQNVNNITKRNIIFTDKEIKSLQHLQLSASRHEIFAPIQQSKVDIPCAECGCTMLTHEVRKNIEKEMKNCKTLQDYTDILDKYDKYINGYSRPYVNIFKNLVSVNPQMSKEEFLTRFQKRADKYAHGKFLYALAEYNKSRDYYLENGTPEQLKNFDLFRLYVKKYIESQAYLDNEMVTFYNKCLNSLDLENAPVKAIYVFKTSAKKIIQSHRITTYENTILEKDEDPVYTIVFNIFKMGVATADHLIPTSKGGAETKDNLIGLCKTCNKIKSHKDVKTWIIDNNRVKYNLENQMKIIDQMAKEGQIKGFDGWANNIASKIYALTENKIDLRNQFEK